MKLLLRQLLARGHIRIRDFESCGQHLSRFVLTGELARSAREITNVPITGSVYEKLRFQLAESLLGGNRDCAGPALRDPRLLNPGMQKDLRSRVEHQALPNHFEVFRIVCNACASPVSVGTLKAVSQLAEPRHYLVRDTADDLKSSAAGRVEAIESIENRSARPAQEPIPFNQ